MQNYNELLNRSTASTGSTDRVPDWDAGLADEFADWDTESADGFIGSASSDEFAGSFSSGEFAAGSDEFAGSFSSGEFTDSSDEFAGSFSEPPALVGLDGFADNRFSQITATGLNTTFDFNLRQDEEMRDEDEDESDADVVVNDLKEKLKDLGAIVPEGADAETLNLLYKYILKCTEQEADPSEFVKFFSESYEQAVSILSTTKATHIPQPGDNDSTAWMPAVADGQLTEEFQLIVTNIVHTEIIKLMAVKDIMEITPDDLSVPYIFDVVRQSSPQSGFFVSNYMDVTFPYVETVVSTMLDEMQDSREAALRETKRRTGTAFVLMPDVLPNLRRIAAGQDVQIIRQIGVYPTDSFVVRCEKCGKIHKLQSSLMQFICFPSDSTYKAFVFPSFDRCSCGQMFVLHTSVYMDALMHYKKENKKEIRDFLSQFVSFCTGSVLLSVSPDIQQIREALDYMIYQADGAVPEDPQGKKNERELDPADIVDVSMYQNAVKAFYTKLSGLRRNVYAGAAGELHAQIGQPLSASLNSDVSAGLGSSTVEVHDFGLSEAACYIAQCAGKDYVHSKNLALFSLITYLRENPLFNEYLDVSRINWLRSEIIFMKSRQADFNRLSDDVFTELYSMAVADFGADIPAPSDLRDRNVLKDFIFRHLSELEDRLASLQDLRECLINDLEASRYALAYCRIANYQVYPVSDIIRIMTDEHVFQVMSEIADMMVVCNCAADFFDTWCATYKSRAAVRLKKRLNESSNSEAIMRAAADVAVPVNSPGLGGYMDYLPLCWELSLEKYKVINRIYQYEKQCSYYQFIKEAGRLGQRDLELFFGQAYRDRIIMCLSAVSLASQRIAGMSEAEFYLGGMFSPEELKENADEFDAIIFGRYVLRRDPGESPSDYVRRYNRLSVEDGLNIYNSTDNLKYFMTTPGASLFCTGAALYDNRYVNFCATSFITAVCFSVTSYGGERDILQQLGIPAFHAQLVRNSAKRWAFSDFSLINNEQLCRLLDGIYFTSIESQISVFGKEFSLAVVAPSAAGRKLRECIDVRVGINAAFSRAKAVIAADEGLVDDLEEGLDEIAAYTSEAFADSLEVSV